MCVLKRLPCQSKPDSSLTCYYLPAFFVVLCVPRQFWVLVNFSNSKVGLMGRTATSETIEHSFCLAGFAIINLEAGLMVRWLWIKDDLEYAGFCTWPGSWNDCFVLLYISFLSEMWAAEPPVVSHTPMRSVRPYWKSWSPGRGGQKNRHFTAHRALAHREKSGCSHTIWKCLVKTLRLLVCSRRVWLLPLVLNVFCAIPHARRWGAQRSFFHAFNLTYIKCIQSCAVYGTFLMNCF